MKKRTWIRGGVVVLFFMLICVAGLFASEGDVLVEPAFESRQRPGALFDHDAHMDLPSVEDCYTCHHVYEDGALVEGESSDDQLCSECHAVAPTDGGTRLATAFHRLCETCHIEQKQGPLACGECHVK